MSFTADKSSPRKAGLCLALSILIQYANALDITLCASANTASGDKISSHLQSNGLCSGSCRASYVYAITSQEDCWCSNDRPAQSDTVSTTDCNSPCPGYPFEFCGANSPKLYSYLELKPDPNANKDSTSTSTSTSTPSPTSDTPTQHQSETVKTVTADGTTRTVVVMPSATGGSPTAKPVSKSSSGLNGGAIAGVVMGCIIGIGMMTLFVWFLLWRKRQNERDDYGDDGSSRGRSASHQHNFSIGDSAASPGSAGNRSSMLQVDPRMDPFKQGLYLRSGSAESLNTLRDDHDYSRRIQQPKVLRATNPDPDT